MQNSLNKILFTITLFITLSAPSYSDPKDSKEKTQQMVKQIENCLKGTATDSLQNDNLENRIERALIRIDTEGIEECNRLRMEKDRIKCMKALNLAREMIIAAHQKRLAKIACR
jgi:hypothetical protein